MRRGAAPRHRAHRLRLPPLADVDQAVDHDDRDRRAARSTELEHPRPLRTRQGQRPARPRARTRRRRTAALERHLREPRALGGRGRRPPRRPGPGFSADAQGPVYDEARAAFADAWGAEPVDIGVGGSIPFVAAFAERVPGRGDPRHRRRGPRHPGTRRERVAPPRRVRAGLPRRSRAPRPARRARPIVRPARPDVGSVPSEPRGQRSPPRVDPVPPARGTHGAGGVSRWCHDGPHARPHRPRQLHRDAHRHPGGRGHGGRVETVGAGRPPHPHAALRRRPGVPRRPEQRPRGRRTVAVTVADPLGREVPAAVLVDEGPGGRRTAYVESAQAAGLHLLAADERDPALTSTLGVGQLLDAAVAEGAERVVVGLGGSGTQRRRGRAARRRSAPATPPGSPSAVSRSADLDGDALPGPRVRPVPARRRRARHRDRRRRPAPRVPGASAVYAAQKGPARSSPRSSSAPSAGSSSWSGRASRRAPTSSPGPAAARATARRRCCRWPRVRAHAPRGAPGERRRARASRPSRFETVLAAADLVLTGEGTFDWQSLHGKVVAGVATAPSGTRPDRRPRRSGPRRPPRGDDPRRERLLRRRREPRRGRRRARRPGGNAHRPGGPGGGDVVPPTVRSVRWSREHIVAGPRLGRAQGPDTARPDAKDAPP